MAKPATARTEQIEIVDNEFDLSNCQVVRREFFAHTFEPTIKFTATSIQFNTACLKKFPGTQYVHVLMGREKKQLIIRICDENSKGALRWCAERKKDGVLTSREIKGPIFTAKVFELMGWNPNYIYKVLGTVLRVFDERILVFKLDECETFFPSEPKQGEEEAQTGTGKRKYSRKPHYPAEWRESFGIPVSQQKEQIQVDLLENYARYDFVRPQGEQGKKNDGGSE